jgi:hypothetical protein
MYEVAGEKEKAVSIAKQVFDEANAVRGEMEQLNEDDQETSKQTLELLEDNISLWTSDEPDEYAVEPRPWEEQAEIPAPVTLEDGLTACHLTETAERSQDLIAVIQKLVLMMEVGTKPDEKAATSIIESLKQNIPRCAPLATRSVRKRAIFVPST